MGTGPQDQSPAMLSLRMPSRARSSYIATVVAIFLVLAVMATLAAAIWIARTQAVEEWQQQIDNVSLVLAEQTAQEVKSAVLVLDSVAESMVGNDIFTEEQLRAQMGSAAWFASLRDKIQGLPQVDVATIVAANGDIINLTRAHPAPSPPINLADREYFQAHVQQPDLGVYISAPVRNRSNGQWTFYLSRRLNGPRGEFLGLVMVGFSSTFLSDFYQKINLGDGATVALYRRDAMLMARWPHDDARMGRVAATPPWPQAPAAQASLLDNGDVDGGASPLPRLAASRVIDKSLIITLSVTDKLYLAQWRRSSAALALAGAISVAAIVAAFLVLIRSLKRRERDMEEMRTLQASAEAANRAKSAFLTMMSHEIRTPLTAIIGFADMLQQGGTAAAREDAAAVISRNGHQLLDIINDILDLAKIEAGRLPLETLPYSPLDVARGVTATMGAQAQAKGISFTLHADGPMPGAVLGDPTRLRQILFNLCGNAVKFTEHGGVQLALAYDGAAGRLRCTVTDTGIGIDAAQRARLFQPFSQADAAVARKYGGTGLGLHLVQQLAQRMDGVVSVSSEAGWGAVFTVDIAAPAAPGAMLTPVAPVTAVATAAITAAPDAAPRRLRGTVLVAEDGADNRRLIGAYLTRLGLSWHAVENGALAVDAALAGRYDLVLMDIRMPVLDGVDAVQALRARGFTRPVIALTANVMADDLVRYAQAGFDRTIGKPIDFALFTATLAELMGEAQAEPDPLEARFDAELDAIRAAFTASLGPRLAELARLVAQADWGGAGDLAHQLKGAGGSFGYPGVSRCARLLESAAASQDGAAARAALAELLTLEELAGKIDGEIMRNRA